MDEEFENEIIDLIKRKQEGGYWDYKIIHHKDSQDLLHDIICMSNNLENRDSYIIFGIEDKTGSIKGVENDEKYDLSYFRKNLKDKDFAGGVRPEIDLKSFFIEGCKISVLIIKNSGHTPFYLNTSYREVIKYHIYTRVNDTNTDKRCSADPNHVEYLWRKRFGFGHSRLEQLKLLLEKPEDWTDLRPRFVHNYLPEFNIILGEGYELGQTCGYFYPIDGGRVGELQLNYLSIPLADFQWWSLDYSSIYVGEAQVGRIWIDMFESIDYYYYSRESLNWKITRFLMEMVSGGEEYLNHHGGSPFIIFDDNLEKNKFEMYLYDNMSLLEKDYSNEIEKVLKREEENGVDRIDAKSAWTIRRIFDKWKGINETIPKFEELFRSRKSRFPENEN